MPQKEKINQIEKNGMTIKWCHSDELIEIEMHTPTSGWLAVGFNEIDGLEGTYLIMGAVSEMGTTLYEHYIFKPGDYRSFENLGIASSVQHVHGQEGDEGTTIMVHLPNDMMSKYTKLLSKGARFHMLMAYSAADDFDHHSMMRTSINVKL
ncbi:MAG: hypothetical protein ACJA08_002572 [Cyclobacteriaceae bacterium]|jgi:hypothetical protein